MMIRENTRKTTTANVRKGAFTLAAAANGLMSFSTLVLVVLWIDSRRIKSIILCLEKEGHFSRKILQHHTCSNFVHTNFKMHRFFFNPFYHTNTCQVVRCQITNLSTKSYGCKTASAIHRLVAGPVWASHLKNFFTNKAAKVIFSYNLY